MKNPVSMVSMVSVAVAVCGLTALAPRALHADETPTLESAGEDAGRMIRAKQGPEAGDKQEASGSGAPGTVPKAQAKAVGGNGGRGAFPYEGAKEQFKKKGLRLTSEAVSGSWKIVARVTEEQEVGVYDSKGIGNEQMRFGITNNPLTRKQAIELIQSLAPHDDAEGGSDSATVVSPVSLTSERLAFSVKYRRKITCREVERFTYRIFKGGTRYPGHKNHYVHRDCEDKYEYECHLVDSDHLLCREEATKWRVVNPSDPYKDERLASSRSTSFMGFARSVPVARFLFAQNAVEAAKNQPKSGTPSKLRELLEDLQRIQKESLEERRRPRDKDFHENLNRLSQTMDMALKHKRQEDHFGEDLDRLMHSLDEALRLRQELNKQ